MKCQTTIPDKMNEQNPELTGKAAIRAILEQWAANTQAGRQEEILANHDPDVVIFDVLPPLKYEGAAAYKSSWAEWQPKTAGGELFELQELQITAGDDVGFAHAMLHCGGKLLNGKTFEDIVRATFCFRRSHGKWTITHQHISKPFVEGQ
jgi:ketosteroid isomerase-like protein